MEHAQHTNGPEDDPGAEGQAVQGAADGTEAARPARPNRAGLGQPITGAPAVPDEPDGRRGDQD